MAINSGYTDQQKHTGVKFLVYGGPGAGKTQLITTLPKPIIISAESGLMTLNKSRLPFLGVSTFADFREAVNLIANSPQYSSFESIALDSFSEIAEITLKEMKACNKDPRMSYFTMQEMMVDILRMFRNMNKNVYFTLKEEQILLSDNSIHYRPSMPGKVLPCEIQYYFDNCFRMVKQLDHSGKWIRCLQTDGLPNASAKNRANGALDMFEICDLGAIINKMQM